MCGIRDLSTSPEMSLSELETVARHLRALKLHQVILTGGEPLLRGDIVEIVRLFSRHGFLVRLQTNGGIHVTESLLDRCYEAGLNDISVSMDTLDPEKQDRICQATDVLKYAQQVIRYCLDRHGSRGVVAVNVVVSAENLFELPAIIRYIDGMGAFFSPCIFTRPFSHPSVEDHRHKGDPFSLSALDTARVGRLFEDLRGLIRENRRVLMSTRLLNDLERYIRTGDHQWECRAGELSMDILPSGELIPCCDTADSALESPSANLKRDDFLRIYRSPAFRKKCVNRRSQCPGCLYGCYREPTYLATDWRVLLEALYKTIRFKRLF